MSYMNTHAAFAPAGGIQELNFDELDLVEGARGIGSVSSDAVFGAGVAIILTSGGNPVSCFVGGFLIGWSIG
jgi:hypothetical protein